jgi:4-hydroxybenzoate polyprenyltransferase
MDHKHQDSTARPTLYVPPKTGFLSLLPQSWVPYAQLMRLDKPGGFYAFYFPYITGLAYASCIVSDIRPPPRPSDLLHQALIFLVGCIFLRGAACTWNDNIDQEFDRKVERCRFRPIARGAVSSFQGHIFTFALTIVGSSLFTLLPTECIYDAVPISALFAIYPFGKRFTNYPQLILGFPFAGAIFMSCHALDIDPLTVANFSSTATLLSANVLWTMVYDTIYAHQDKKDDEKAGVKSMAVLFKDSTKNLTSVLGVFIIILLVATGILMHLSYLFFVLTCGGTALSLTAMIGFVNLESPASCMWWFTWGFWLVGGSLVSGFWVEYGASLL